ncbi:MAG TPA: asparagine synthase (glutamine-hydrolyzing) [Bryobacteraceae bacterium]|nr:asparagine synthase (glutamine-hydrolyzing) [Bryobacteraceae bacterium]
MCGIAGFTHVGRAPAPGRIQAITEALRHRGPDQQGVWESAHVSLGAVRLKIIDLEHGTQPMSCGGAVIVYNGEVYNHDELRRELEELGHRFESRCDTEVVLHAFLEWDVAAFARLRGMYAAALWTEAERRLVLVRDRMGIKPLYFAHPAGSRDLYFGSELKTILAHPHLARCLDPAALDRYLALNYSPGPHTLIEGIEKLPPGHWLEWRDGKLTTDAYWQPHFEVDRTLDLNSAKEELDRLLRASVREHLVADVPLGVWSSGGLDSSTILHYAAESATGRLKTFSVSFRGREFDESEYFREVAQRYQTDHHEFDLNPEQDLTGAIERLGTYSDEPSADAGALPVWFLSKMCRREVTVALSGEGADELFGGYNTYLADRYARWLRHLPVALRRTAAGLAHRAPVSDRKIGLDYKLTRMLDGSLLNPVEAHFFWNGTFTREQVRELRESPDGAWADLPAPDASAGELNRFLELDQMYYLPDDILNKCDRMSMAHSLEVRPPFLDHRIVEFAATLPEHLKIKGGTLKFLLRELMKGRLPATVLKRPKEGFDIPTHAWLRTILRPLLLDTLSERSVRDSGFLRWDAVNRTIQTHLERRANLGYHLWGLLILFLWMKRWNIQAPASAERAAVPFTSSSAGYPA